MYLLAGRVGWDWGWITSALCEVRSWICCFLCVAVREAVPKNEERLLVAKMVWDVLMVCYLDFSVKWNETFQLTWNEGGFIYSLSPPGLCCFFADGSRFYFVFFLIWNKIMAQNLNIFWGGPYLLCSAGLLLGSSFSRAAHSWLSLLLMGSLQGFAAAPVQTTPLSPFQKSLVLAPGVDTENCE